MSAAVSLPLPQPAGCDFGFIGHIEGWHQGVRYLSLLAPNNPRRPTQRDVEQLWSYFPARTVFRISATSPARKTPVSGVYVDAFISPSELSGEFVLKNLAKVKAAAERCIAEGAKVTSLGGFSSIVLEGDAYGLKLENPCAFTTGNTLTAALIAKNVERACALRGKRLDRVKLLVIGSTGDIGSACVAYFKHKVGALFLCARNQQRLAQQAAELAAEGVACAATSDLDAIARSADVIIAVASVAKPTFLVEGREDDVIVCDAGYPKNFSPSVEAKRQNVFYGGLGLLEQGFTSSPTFLPQCLGFVDPRIAHGCLLEGMLLAMEDRYESYSVGRGNITVERIDEMWSMAQKHGLRPSPLFNLAGPWDEQP